MATRTFYSLLVMTLLAVAPAHAAQAQRPPDIDTLEGRLAEAHDGFDRQASTLDRRSRADLQTELVTLDDDLAYLRVKTRRKETVTERERREIADRLDTLIRKLDQGQRETSAGADEIPSGTELDARLSGRLSSKDAVVEDKVMATTLVNFYRGDELLVPAGSTLEGTVVAVEKATRTDRKGSVNVRFDRLVIGARAYPVKMSLTQALESEGVKGEAGKIGAGAGVGAILGGILGGMKGAITGILVGGGGVLVATEGTDVDLPSGSVLRVRFDAPLALGR